jgi:hypothetical protein
MLAATMLGNTSELGSQALLVFSAAGDAAPTAEVRCVLQSSRASEATVEAELVLQPGRTNQTVVVSGVPDILDDGTQQFAISVGPCKSIDPRFHFDGVRETVASGWNEDHGFPLVEEIEPTQSAMLGESITIHGRHLTPETNVCVNGISVSGRPDYRVSLTIVSPSGDATAFEVTLRNPAAMHWFQNVSGTEYRLYAPRACPQPFARRRPSVRLASAAAATAASNRGALNNALAASAAKGVDIKSVRFAVIDLTKGLAENASFSSTVASGLDIPGTLVVADLELDFIAVSSMPTEPLLNQARTQSSSAYVARELLTPPLGAEASRFGEHNGDWQVARRPGHSIQLL